jgi:hypothetical protein
MRCCLDKKKGLREKLELLGSCLDKGEREELTMKLQGMKVDELQLQVMEQPVAV